MACKATDAWGNTIEVDDYWLKYRTMSLIKGTVYDLKLKGRRVFINYMTPNEAKMVIICKTSEDAKTVHDYIREKVGQPSPLEVEPKGFVEVVKSVVEQQSKNIDLDFVDLLVAGSTVYFIASVCKSVVSWYWPRC